MNKDWHNITLTIEECYTTFILLPGHRTQCYKDDEVTGFISNHLPNGVESSSERSSVTSGGLGTATRKEQTAVVFFIHYTVVII